MGCDRSAHPARKIGQPKGIGSSDALGPRGKVRQGMVTVAIPSRQRRAGRARSNAGRDTFAAPARVAIPAILRFRRLMTPATQPPEMTKAPRWAGPWYR